MRTKVILFLVVLFLYFPPYTDGADMTQPRLLRVSLIQGDVTYQRSDLDKWVDLSINTPILEGDKVWSGRDGRVEIEFEDGSTIRLAENTVAGFSSLGRYSDLEPVRIQINRGVASFGVMLQASPFTIETPIFTVLGQPSSSLRVDVDSDGSARLVVFEGKAEVQSQAATLLLRSGETFRLLSTEPDRYYLGTDYQLDEWDQWNSERNQYLARLGQQRRSSDDWRWDYAELDSYGSWYDIPEYGRAWRPYSDTEWVPFRDGRWTWYDSFGWTWISHEPWGWLPYHYGRWALVGGFGWCWVPGGFYDPWCPGAVSWVMGPSWVGWCPLAPYEPWYAYQHAHASNVFVSKNYRYRDCITYLPRETFVNGTAVGDFRPPGDPVGGGGRVIGGQPDIVPTAMSRMPVTTRMAVRKYDNDDLAARGSQRNQIIQPTGASPSSATSGSGQTGTRALVDERRSVREQIENRGPQVQTIGKNSGSSSGVQVITGGNERPQPGASRDTVRTLESSPSAREGTRSSLHNEMDRYWIPGTSANESRNRPEGGEDRAQTVPGAAPDSRVFTSSPAPRDSNREAVQQTYTNRSDNGSDRSSNRPAREWNVPANSGNRANSYTPPPRVESPAIHPDPSRSPSTVAPPPSSSHVSSPISPSPRESTSQTRSEVRSSGGSTQDSRSAARSRGSR
jgi:hypothetical protein